MGKPNSTIFPIGQRNKKSKEQLMSEMEIESVRVFRKSLAKLRESMVICSGSGGGYWMPESREELERYIAFHNRKIKSWQKSVALARLKLSEMEGQYTLDIGESEND